jgi:hypothetical protein
MVPENIEQIVAKETLMVFFLSSTLVIGMIIRMMSRKYKVNFKKNLMIDTIHSYIIFDWNVFWILLLLIPFNFY